MKKTKLTRAATLITSVIAVLAVAGCGGGRTVRLENCTAPVADLSPDYIIGAGDSLEIFVWRNPELSTNVPVRADGKISIPLVEDMDAAGKTPSALARDIESVLAEYVRNPNVNVLVAAEGGSSMIQIVGQVAIPQALPYRDGMRVLDVMVAAGGLEAFAAGNRTKLVRSVDGQALECGVRLDDLIKSGDMTQNVRVMPGDVLIVPEARF